MKLFTKDLSVDDVLCLLTDFDRVFTPAISEELQLQPYAEKLSRNGHFVMARTSLGEGRDLDGFIAYYLNPEGSFAYIPFIAVKPNSQQRGIGHLMLEYLVASLGEEYGKIMLEVRKDNHNGYNFYLSNGFTEAEDRGEKLLMVKNLK